MSFPSLVLASTSAARRTLMDSLRVPYSVEAPGVEEHVEPGLSVVETVRVLAERKAQAVAARHPAAWVIGSDQLLAWEGRPLGKPADRAAARAQLGALLGQTHELHTGLCLIRPGHSSCEVDTARLTVYPLSNDELERYLDLEEWRNCAGSYRVEGAGRSLFSNVSGDVSGVQGLPLTRLVRMLREAGFPFFR